MSFLLLFAKQNVSNVLDQTLGKDLDSKILPPRCTDYDCFVRILEDFHLDNIPLLSKGLNFCLLKISFEIIMGIVDTFQSCFAKNY